MKKDSQNQDRTLLLAKQAAIENNMRQLRNYRVMLEPDVAALYEVSPEYLRKQVHKNKDRFSEDFMFQLTAQECGAINKEKPVAKSPYAFTESGILMTGGILNNPKAIKIHIQLIGYFVQLYNEAIKEGGQMKELVQAMENESTEEIFTAIKQLLKEG